MIKKFLLSLLLFMSALTVLANAADLEIRGSYELLDMSETSVGLLSVDEWEKDWTCYRDQLSEDALTIYEAIQYAMKEDSIVPSTVSINGIPTACWAIDVEESFSYSSDADFYAKYDELEANKTEVVVLACQAFSFDHPECFWIRQDYLYGISASGTSGKGTLTLTAGFVGQPSCDTLAERDALQAQITPVISEILTAVENMTTVQKLEYFDNWLAANNHYNHTAAGTSNYIDTDDTPWSIVGALLDGYSPVCEGYAKAFQLLCKEIGVPCVQISGLAQSNSGAGHHMWAAVQLNDEWYFCDPTWNDPTIGNSGDRDYSTKTYFLTAQPTSHMNTMPLIIPEISEDAYDFEQDDPEQDEPADLIELAAPTDLTWGNYFFEDQTGNMQAGSIAGMISWTVADTTVDSKYLIQVFRKGEPDQMVYETNYSYRAGENPVCTEFDFSNRFPRNTLTSGDYYFTVQTFGDGVTTANSQAVSSDIWTYSDPEEVFTTEYIDLSWQWPTAEWDECYDETYLSNNCGYLIEYWYSDEVENATSVDEFERLGGYVWYFCEGRADNYHVIPQAMTNRSGYYYFTVRFLSDDVSTVSHTGRMISDAFYFAEDEQESGINSSGILTIVDTESAGDGHTTDDIEGWVWEGGILTLKAVEGVAIRAIRFLPYAGGAEIVLHSDFTLDCTGVEDPAGEYRWDMQSAVEMESKVGTLVINTGEYTLTCVSDVNGIHSNGSLIISDSTIYTKGEENCIYVDRGDLIIQNSDVEAECSLYGWGIYVHGIRSGENRVCQMGDLIIDNAMITVTSSEEEGSGNALYADGNITISSSDVDVTGDNNGIGNDVGDIIITDSTVRSVGEFLGICTYGTLTIDSSSVYAEGIRAIEVISWDENEPPKVEDLVLKNAEISMPKKADIQLVTIRYPWEDRVINVVDVEKGVSAAVVQIVVPLALEEQLEAWNGVAAGQITAEAVQKILAGHLDEIRDSLTDDHNQVGGVTEMVRGVEEKITDIKVVTTVTDDVSAFEEATIVGAKLNAATGISEMELQIAEVSARHEVPDGYHDLTAFSMRLDGAVDGDMKTAGQQMVVPVKITLPLPVSVNPALLVVLHYNADGSYEEIIPYVYEEDGRWYASFVVTGFSDFALASVDVTAKRVTTGVQVDAEFIAEMKGQVVCAAYDVNGKQLGVPVLDYVTTEKHTMTIVCDTEKVHTVKLYFLSDNGTPVLRAETAVLN